MKTLVALVALIALAGCTAKPPECTTQTIFYNDIPGCTAEVEQFKLDHPKEHAAWELEQKRKNAILRAKLLEKLFGINNSQ